jgi:hypothetical protein
MTKLIVAFRKFADAPKNIDQDKLLRTRRGEELERAAWRLGGVKSLTSVVVVSVQLKAVNMT